MTITTGCASRRCGFRNREGGKGPGLTLLELLIAMIISVIAMFGLALPFVAERSFWGSGNRQTEAQRDAQICLKAMALAAREGNAYTLNAPGDVTFAVTGCPGGRRFQGGPGFNNQLRFIDGCAGGAATLIIDGARSRVTDFTLTAVSGRMVRVRLDVAQGNQEMERLETELFVRNAT